MTLTIESIDNDTFSVSINSDKDTQHTVTFSDKQRESYNLGHIEKDVIIKYAFDRKRKYTFRRKIKSNKK